MTRKQGGRGRGRRGGGAGGTPTFHRELLDGAALPAAAVRGEAEAADAAARAHPGAQHVLGVQIVAALRAERR